MGDIGGQMGLFIGASILTILELFDYVYEVIKVTTKLSKITAKTVQFRRNHGVKHCAKENEKKRLQRRGQS